MRRMVIVKYLDIETLQKAIQQSGSPEPIRASLFLRTTVKKENLYIFKPHPPIYPFLASVASMAKRLSGKIG